MKHWVPTKKIIISSLSLGVFGVILYFVSVFMVYREVGQLKFSYTETKSRISEEETINEVSIVAKENNFLIDYLNNFFIKDGEGVAYIEKIENEAKENLDTFEIDSIVKNASNIKFSENILLRVKMESSWSGIMKFVDSLEKMPFGVLPINLTLDKQGDKWFGRAELVLFVEK